MNLTDPLTKHFRLKEAQTKALKRIGVVTVRDLLHHFPTRYGDATQVISISRLTDGENATVYGKVKKIETGKTQGKVPVAKGTVTDGKNIVDVIWFRQPYIAKQIYVGADVKIDGKVTERNGRFSFVNPEIQVVEDVPLTASESLFGDGEAVFGYPIYKESRGITSKWMHHAIARIFSSGVLDTIRDPLPETILKKYNLPTLRTALIWIHTPKKKADSEAARKRFAFEEIFYIQITKQKNRLEYEHNPSFVIKKTQSEIDTFTKRFSFKLTKAQNDAISRILKDMATPVAMSRLLEGDVGSGKTAVAATVAHAIVTTRPPRKDEFGQARPENQTFGNLQVAYMAPTEILARQHFQTFIELFAHLPIQIGLITSSGCKKFPSKVNPREATQISRTKLLEWTANGEIPILIGTHSLIAKSVEFENLACVVIDEQHRFGVKQRKALRKSTRILRRSTQKTSEKPPQSFLYSDLSYKLRDIFYEIYNSLGPGHKEHVYQQALKEELLNQNVAFEQEEQIPVTYRGKKIGVYQPDFVIDDKIIIETKALPYMGDREHKQTWNYLKGSSYRLAFLVNFGQTELDIKRIVYDTARDVQKPHNQRESASHLHQSAEVLPHLLTMTATPIPRTLALTMYGDLDITLLDQNPKGRKQITTKVVLPNERDGVYDFIREKVREGRQAYVICPRISEPDAEKEGAVLARAVETEAKRLREKIFPELTITELHGKMTPKEKEKTLKEFTEGKSHILVATSVVEVGVNVPNATMIIIEGAERFGLAQLHQLRGRVMRSHHEPYCFVFTESNSKKTKERLNALTKAKNGFELAEYDLAQRGAGELVGRAQSGISDLGMEAIKNLKMVEAARTEARALVETDKDLKNYPLLKKHIQEIDEVHEE